MRTRFLALLALGGCAGVAFHEAVPGDALTFEGRLDRAPLGLSPADLEALPPARIRGTDPATGREATFAGAAVAPLLEDGGLPLKRGADLLAFHGAGGRRAAVPVNAVRQMRPVLAAEEDGRTVGGPADGRLLAWPDVDSPGLATDPRLRWWWLRGVKRVEALSWEEADGRALRVPPGAGDDARRGADAFATSCMTCHRIRSRGGTTGPELTRFLAGAEPGRLPGLLAGHLSARSGQPGVPDLPAAAVGWIASFLRAVALADDGQPPGEEIREPEVRPPPPLPGPGPRRP